jgi:hypothetical protein
MLQLLQRGIPFLAFDFKQDYRHLLGFKMNIYILSWETWKFNPLRAPLGCHPLSWAQSFTNVFAESYWLRSGTKSIIQDHMVRLLTDYGVFQGKDIYPSMQDLRESIYRDWLEKKYGREKDFLESAKNRLDECLVPLNEVFDCDRGFPLEDLLKHAVILELDGLLAENRLFLVTIILRFIFEYRMSTRYQRG